MMKSPQVVTRKILFDTQSLSNSGVLSSSTNVTQPITTRSISIGKRRSSQINEGVQAAITHHELPWTVQQLGCRAEYWFADHPQNGAQAAATVNDGLESYMHLYALNRGILLTPFHNMALMTPFHTEEDVDLHTSVFTKCLEEIMS